MLEIVDSTILKEIVGNIIGTKSAKLLFIWNTFNNWQLPTDGKLKLQVFAIFIRFPSTVLDFVRSRKWMMLHISSNANLSVAYYVEFLSYAF